MTDAPLIETWQKLLPTHLDAEEGGFPLVPMLARLPDGGLVMGALHKMLPTDLLPFACMQLIAHDHCSEFIIACDRYTKPGQGNRHGSTLTVYHWSKGHPPEAATTVGWRFGTVDYDAASGTIEAVDWTNRFWIAVMTGEVAQLLQTLLKAVGTPPGVKPS